jgi:hypothetical protein
LCGLAVGVALVATMTAGGCSRGDAVPSELVDGSTARPPPVVLEGAPTPQVLTKVSMIATRRATSATIGGRCAAAARRHGRDDPIAVRIGAASRSVTLRDASGRMLVACDGAGRRGDARWCGGAYGVLDRGRLRDPRLETVAGDPIAFAWYEPGPSATYVAVRQRDYGEVYPVAGALPVRITTTTGISVADSSATFEISEHDARGRLLHSSTLEARVAG